VTDATRLSPTEPRPPSPAGCLQPGEHAAALELVRRVRRAVDADLVQAVVFGSRTRGEARPDSDVDLLLIFRALPPDREPQAGHAEALAAGVAWETGVPVEVWSVSLPDLQRGRRTPMLVDALEDGVALWPDGRPVPRIRFTPDDACFCAASLLEHVAEGAREFAARTAARDTAAFRRGRDDLVRLCTALLLMAGETRPRRAGAVRRMLAREQPYLSLSSTDRALLAWAARSYGPGSGDEEAPVPPPPAPVEALAELIERLRGRVRRRLARLACGSRQRFAGR
jgi:uncharacterized protein